MPYVIFTLIGLFILNNLWLIVYCSIQKKMDKKTEELRRNQHKLKLKNTNSFVSNQRNDYQGISLKKCILKKGFTVYSFLEHYFYGWMRYCVILTGKIPSNRIRNLFYRVVFQMDITTKTVISGGCEFRSPWNIHANNCVIQANCILDGRSSIVIGDNVVFGTGVHIWTQEHDINDPYFRMNFENAQMVTIGERSWICSDSTLLPGVSVGVGAVVASGAVVTKNCDSFGIYAGIPAKKIGERNQDLQYVLSGKPHWHFY